ncbi:MAG: hypothetical protein SPH70_03860 [Candidatus Cryptobacteroides sp.]|nr:hypothetical protein [Bacteroidales bacterium]MDY6158195.1 hypothetical protein [Candidatus Cryptobacteroides sp.]
MTAKEIFPNLGEFQKYSDGMVADTSIEQLMPSIRSSIRDINEYIPKDVFDAILGGAEDEPLELLKSAIASGASYKYQIFASAKKNGSEASMYKYQHEEVKAHHLESYWASLDALLDWLDAHSDSFNWSSTSTFSDREQLPVKNAHEFDKYFGIGNSSHFYFKVLYLIRQVWNGDIAPALPSDASEKIMELAKQALCYKVMAHAVMQFDITELPRSVRFDDSHEYSKSTQPQQRTSLYNQFISRYTSLMQSIDRAKASAAGVTGLGTAQDEDQKYYATL